MAIASALTAYQNRVVPWLEARTPIGVVDLED